jgi:nucleoside-diphosphate-sugar epimerase
MNTIVVTGGLGFIGSNLIKILNNYDDLIKTLNK